MDIIKEIRQCITSAINIIKIRTSTTNGKLHLTPLAAKQPVNKHIEKQRPFFSTKRKRKASNLRIRKPTVTEKDDIRASLQSNNLSMDTKRNHHNARNISVSEPLIMLSFLELYILLQKCCSAYVQRQQLLRTFHLY